MEIWPDWVPSLLALPAVREMPHLGYLSVLTAVRVLSMAGGPPAEHFMQLLELPQAQEIPANQLYQLLSFYVKPAHKVCMERLLR